MRGSYTNTRRSARATTEIAPRRRIVTKRRRTEETIGTKEIGTDVMIEKESGRRTIARKGHLVTKGPPLPNALQLNSREKNLLARLQSERRSNTSQGPTSNVGGARMKPSASR